MVPVTWSVTTPVAPEGTSTETVYTLCPSRARPPGSPACRRWWRTDGAGRCRSTSARCSTPAGWPVRTPAVMSSLPMVRSSGSPLVGAVFLSQTVIVAFDIAGAGVEAHRVLDDPVQVVVDLVGVAVARPDRQEVRPVGVRKRSLEADALRSSSLGVWLMKSSRCWRTIGSSVSVMCGTVGSLRFVKASNVAVDAADRKSVRSLLMGNWVYWSCSRNSAAFEEVNG